MESVAGKRAPRPWHPLGTAARGDGIGLQDSILHHDAHEGSGLLSHDTAAGVAIRQAIAMQYLDQDLAMPAASGLDPILGRGVSCCHEFLLG